MKTNARPLRVPTRFGRATRFQLKFKPQFVSLARDQAQEAFAQLKTRLLEPVLDEAMDATVRRQLLLAANEAAAVAWTTPFPLLVLPVLLEEKAAEAREYAVRREAVQSASDALVEAVS